VTSKVSQLRFHHSFSELRLRKSCYPQFRHEFSPISPRRLSRRHCLPKNQRLYEIERKPLDVPGLVQSVQTNADSNRDALGFLPAQAYEQAARQGTLFVAVHRRGQERRYAGHILFGASYPHAKIFQVYVAAEHRDQGTGRLLIQTLLELLEEKQYLSVTARVASDLAANAFWQSLKFEIVATRSGGATRGRIINIRSRQFNTPSLFAYRRPVSGIPLADPLPNFTTILALDLNVFFDVARRRPRSEYGAVVMSAAFNNIVRLTVTQEFTQELRRSATSTQDPILEFALQLPTLPAPPNGVSEQLINQIAAIVFPARAAAGTLTVQDKSDLTHLAIAAHHKITGFVTAEDALVRACQAIESRFGIRVLHVKDLAETLKSTTSVSSPLDIGFSDRDLRLSDVTAKHVNAIQNLPDSVKLPRELRSLALAEGVHASTRQSLAISFEDEVICAAFWQPQSLLQGGLEALLLIDEDQVSSLVSVNALLNRLSRIASARGPSRVHIIIPNSALGSQDVAIRYGFTRCSGSDPEVSRYQRLSIGSVVNATSWPSVRQNLQVTANMRFAEDLGSIADEDLRILFQNQNGTDFMIDLFDLETILSPTLFLLPGRGAVLTPIRASYADDLFGTAAQGSLLPKPQAAILHERTYFSTVRNERLLVKGTPVVFYESGKSNGRSAAVAVARVTSTVVISKSQIAAHLIDCGVVAEEDIKDLSSGAQIAATTVDNVMRLRKPVPLKYLRDLGCIDGSNLVTSRPITSDQLQMIMTDGQGTCE
jgi:ribosomal protein S18 acetylase RimI-like enzyme